MNLVLKHAGGSNLVVRPQVRPAWYPTERSRPVQVEVWWRYEGESPAAAQLIGKFAPGQAVTWPSNPLVDRNIVLSTISISNRGIRSVRDIADAHEELLEVKRETTAPTVTEVRPLAGSSVLHTRIALAVDGYSSLAIKRRIRVADDAGMSVNLTVQESVVSPGEVLPRVVYLDRADSGTGTRTIYVRISHSSGGDYGAESVATAFTYADSAGVGGSGETGEGDPFGQGRFDA